MRGRYAPHHDKTLLLVTLLLGGATAYGATCDRVGLATALDRYLTALVQDDPDAAPLGLGFRQTENAVVTAAGDGL